MKQLKLFAILLILCVPRLISAAVTIELINTSANGVFLVGEVPVTSNSSALSSSSPGRKIVAGNVVMFGRLSVPIALNVPVKALRMEKSTSGVPTGWAILTCPTNWKNKPADLDIYLWKRSAANLGQIKIAVMQEGKRVGDLLQPRKPFEQLYVATYSSGGVTINYIAQ